MVSGRKLRTVSEAGEHEIIEKILGLLSPCPEEVLPVGDDAAALSLGNGMALVVKTDMLVRATDVPPGMSMAKVGSKVVTMNVSDLAAKGVSPKGILVSLGLPRDFLVSDTLDIVRGIVAESKNLGACVMGGDTGESRDLVVSGMAFGFAKESDLVKRSGAVSGDILAVTGPFGLTAAGLKMLLEGIDSEREIKDKLLKAVYEPKARVSEGVALATSGCITSSIDSSDGLAWSIHELSRSSNVGFLVEDIPIPLEVDRFAANNGLDSLDLALHGGEEYELVVTVRRESWEQAVNAVKKVGARLYRIGEATRERRVLLRSKDGALKEIEPRGYEHFR